MFIKGPLIGGILGILQQFEMDNTELQKYELVQSFLHSIKQAQSKQDFLGKVQEFDARFIEDHSGPTMSQKQKSVQKLPPMPQEKPRNPFKTSFDDPTRHQNMMQTGQNYAQPSSWNQQPPARGSYSRTQQNFYQKPQGSHLRTQQPQYNYQPKPQPSYSQQQPYPQPQQQQQQNQFGGGMNMLNYNSFSQRQYDDLKQQFFRPPINNRPLQPYNRISQDVMFGFNQMGLGTSSSTDLLPGDTSFNNKPSARGYPQRVNPFMNK